MIILTNNAYWRYHNRDLGGIKLEMEEADKLTKYLIENLRVSLLY
jgi:hypothetical protein